LALSGAGARTGDIPVIPAHDSASTKYVTDNKTAIRATTMGIIRRRLLPLAAASTLATAAVVALPDGSRATTLASVTLSGGRLAFINNAPAATISFPTATLNDTTQSITTPLTVDTSDATGSGAGWTVTATSTTFTSAANALPTTATTIQSAPTTACDTGAAGCTTATTNDSYPYTLPAAPAAPTATELFNAPANTGMGDQTFTAIWTLAIPANAAASATPYASTWTLSLVTGP
jgi:hypothetical protein